MNKPKSLYKDIVTGVFFITGIFSFMSGAFLVSTLCFAGAALASNIDFTPVVGSQRLTS